MDQKNPDGSEKPPAPQVGGNPQEEDDYSLWSFRVDNLHYHPNEITELRRLAEQNPELAHKIVDFKVEAVRLKDRSFRIGIVSTALLAVTIVISACVTLIYLGPWQSLLLVGVLLGVSHILRVILTGKWSDTSWFGKLIAGKQSSEPDG